MELALSLTLKFYTSVTKGLKLKIRKILRIIPTFVEVTAEKKVQKVAKRPLSILNRVTDFFSKFDQICRKLRICLHLLKKSLMENLICCAVLHKKNGNQLIILYSFGQRYSMKRIIPCISTAQKIP